jgi:hypothetical protein
MSHFSHNATFYDVEKLFFVDVLCNIYIYKHVYNRFTFFNQCMKPVLETFKYQNPLNILTFTCMDNSTVKRTVLVKGPS